MRPSSFFQIVERYLRKEGSEIVFDRDTDADIQAVAGSRLSSIGRGQKRAKISNGPVLGRSGEIRRSNGILCIELNRFGAGDVSDNGFNGNDGRPFFEGLDRLEGWAMSACWSVSASPVEAFLRLPPAISITCFICDTLCGILVC